MWGRTPGAPPFLPDRFHGNPHCFPAVAFSQAPGRCKPFPAGGHLTRLNRTGFRRGATMKTHFWKLLAVSLALILLGSGAAFAGGYKNHSTYSKHGGAYHGGGYYHRPPYQPPHRGYWHPRPYYYGAPPRYSLYQNYYNRGCGPYGGGYYFSGAFSEPGFGFVFGTRGSW